MKNIIRTECSMNIKKRIDEIDIVKALAIIFMVLGHSGAPFTKFIYLFHMAVFFIASGFVFKDSTSDSFKNVIISIIKKIKLLWFPYFFWNMIYTLLHNLFININVYTNNQNLLKYVSGKHMITFDYMSFTSMIKNIIKGAFFSGGTQMGGAFWFLETLFLISVCYCVGDFFAKKFFKNPFVVQLITSSILLIFGYWCSLNGNNIHGIAQVASYYCLYFIGHTLTLITYKYQDWNWKQFTPMLFVSFVVLFILNQFGEINIGINSYINPVFLLTASLMGWCFLYSISYFIALLPIKNFFLKIGKKTMAITIFHFLSFKLVAVIVVKVYELPDFCIAAFPNLYGSVGIWWIAYSVVGVVVPVILNMGYKYIINKLTLCSRGK